MNKNILFILIAIVILGVVGFMVFKSNIVTDRSDIELEIQRLMANESQRDLPEVSVEIFRSDNSHAAGSVMFGQGGPGEGGGFLAVKTGDEWEIVYSGNGSVDCNKMKQQYRFSDEMLRPEFCD